jgi:hypothetical protein
MPKHHPDNPITYYKHSHNQSFQHYLDGMLIAQNVLGFAATPQNDLKIGHTDHGQ